ncbi:hypothetical protein GCM10008965_19550 [Methylorubrum aminovorans]|nr:hypothetical protein GCM10025880_27270 [Methylorubrum aminovorans]
MVRRSVAQKLGPSVEIAHLKLAVTLLLFGAAIPADALMVESAVTCDEAAELRGHPEDWIVLRTGQDTPLIAARVVNR